MIDAAAADAWPQGGLLVVLVPAAFLLGLMLRRGLTAILRHRLAGAARFPVVELVAVGLAVAGFLQRVVWDKRHRQREHRQRGHTRCMAGSCHKRCKT